MKVDGRINTVADALADVKAKTLVDALGYTVAELKAERDYAKWRAKN